MAFAIQDTRDNIFDTICHHDASQFLLTSQIGDKKDAVLNRTTWFKCIHAFLGGYNFSKEVVVDKIHAAFLGNSRDLDDYFLRKNPTNIQSFRNKLIAFNKKFQSNTLQDTIDKVTTYLHSRGVENVAIPFPSDLEEDWSDVEKDPAESGEEIPPKVVTAQELRSKNPLGSLFVHTYLENIKEHNPSFVFLEDLLFGHLTRHPDTFLHGRLSLALDQAEASPEQIAHIPFILKKGKTNMMDHIVTLAINLKEKRLGYYDSQGNPIETQHRKIQSLGISASEFFQKIHQLLKDRTGIDFQCVSNLTRHQAHFTIDCGAFVARHIERCQKGETFEAILKSPIQDIQKERIIMAQSLEQGL